MTHCLSSECCTKTHIDDLLLYSFIFLSLHFCFPCISLRFFNFLYTNIWIYGYGPWNSDERAAVHRQMNTHLLLGQVPRKAECVKCIKNEPCLSQRDWKTVKYFVHTTIQRNKRLQNIIWHLMLCNSIATCLSLTSLTIAYWCHSITSYVQTSFSVLARSHLKTWN